MIKKTLLSGLFALLISTPALAEIKNIKDLPQIGKGVATFDIPFSRPIVLFDSFTEQGKLAVADLSTDVNFLGINRAGLISIWTADKAIFFYCTQTTERKNCVDLNGFNTYVKVDGEIYKLQSNFIPVELQSALANTKGKALVRIDLKEKIIDREIGRGTIESFQDIRTYIKFNPCVINNALCLTKTNP
jgi:hypothetical protein